MVEDGQDGQDGQDGPMVKKIDDGQDGKLGQDGENWSVCKVVTRDFCEWCKNYYYLQFVIII